LLLVGSWGTPSLYLWHHFDVTSADTPVAASLEIADKRFDAALVSAQVFEDQWVQLVRGREWQSSGPPTAVLVPSQDPNLLAGLAVKLESVCRFVLPRELSGESLVELVVALQTMAGRPTRQFL